VVTLNAKTTITIGQKIDNQSQAWLYTSGDVTIHEKVDNGSCASITSFEGGIFVGQKVDNGSVANFTATTGITIKEKVDNKSDATLVCSGPINIPQGVDNNAIVAFQAPHINCPISDHGHLYQLPLDSLPDRVRAAIKRLEAAKARHKAPAK
jgi:hypothetical protein